MVGFLWGNVMIGRACFFRGISSEEAEKMNLNMQLVPLVQYIELRNKLLKHINKQGRLLSKFYKLTERNLILGKAPTLDKVQKIMLDYEKLSRERIL